MDNDVSAGSTTTIVGRLALGVTLLAFGEAGGFLAHAACGAATQQVFHDQHQPG
ncbi:hypothetical protein [Streptomyces cellulosae]|uniref:hypothetical protein n=1 Tax=Streptomyces cellulosae TaxID=1968 RepID=UPI000AAC0F32|nr:hypothetical protein [Streptomyces cellulosae]